MAATSSLSYAFSYGFVGGPLHAKQFKRLMDKAGYVYTMYIQKADIIIAHSAGCWLIPKDCKPKLVIYVGMPLSQTNPRRTQLASKVATLKAGKTRPWSQTKSNYYLLRQPLRNIKIMRMAKTGQPVILLDTEAVFIVNQHDPWPQDDMLENYVAGHDWAFINLPGTHDDIWQHPDRYVEIINHYARLLA